MQNWQEKKLVCRKRENFYFIYKSEEEERTGEETHVLTLQLMQLLFSHDIP